MAVVLGLTRLAFFAAQEDAAQARGLEAARSGVPPPPEELLAALARAAVSVAVAAGGGLGRGGGRPRPERASGTGSQPSDGGSNSSAAAASAAAGGGGGAGAVFDGALESALDAVGPQRGLLYLRYALPPDAGQVTVTAHPGGMRRGHTEGQLVAAALQLRRLARVVGARAAASRVALGEDKAARGGQGGAAGLARLLRAGGCALQEALGALAEAFAAPGAALPYGWRLRAAAGVAVAELLPLDPPRFTLGAHRPLPSPSGKHSEGLRPVRSACSRERAGC